MSETLRAAIRADYDFLVAYENLLRDGTTRDPAPLTMAGAPTSHDGAAGTVWVLRERNPGHAIVHFINLMKNQSTGWRDDNGTCPPPGVLTNLPVKMYYRGVTAGKLWVATPDRDDGRPSALTFSVGRDAGGTFIRFTLPRLEYWTMAWLGEERG